MAVNKYKIVKSSIGKQIDIPIEVKWDFSERDQAIDTYQNEVLDKVLGEPTDFELTRFVHGEYIGKEGISGLTKVNYEFFFFNTGFTINNINAWQNSYLPEGFTGQDVYFFSKPFTKSFFKLDFYDTVEKNNQKNYFTIILPVQQGEYETITISSYLSNIDIRKPKFGLDYIGDKEGFYIYWLRHRDYIDLDQFYMSAKFFDARLGVFVRMMNRPQSDFAAGGNFYNFNPQDFFFQKVKLNYLNRTYEIYDYQTNLRIGTDNNPIKWYEFLTP
jgi:hypothetical protein